MKRDRIEYSKTIQTGTPLNPSWEKAFIGATLDDGEDPKESLEILKREVEEFHKRSINGNYISNEWIPTPNLEPYTTSSSILRSTSAAIVPTIQRSYEKLEIQIDNCKSLEELKELKEGLPRDLMSAYMNKLRALTEKI